MDRRQRPKAPGLKWRKRATGPDVPIWLANPAAIDAGFRPKSVRLEDLADNDAALVARCITMEGEMRTWMRTSGVTERRWDGSFRALFELYQTDPKSPYRTTLKRGTVKLYTVYLKKMVGHIGGLYIDQSDGRDVMEWFAEWRQCAKGKDQLPAALACVAVLKAAVSFGIVCRKDGVKAFQDVLAELTFPKPRGREHAPTAEHIIAARLAAHKNDAPRRALLYALQFETTARQWDFIGAWHLMSDKRVSGVIAKGEKWVGPHWSDIDANLILTIKPTKTEDTTEVEITYDLSACPMVVEELANFPQAMRTGPLIFNEQTGIPYRGTRLVECWRKDYALAGIPPEIWNRDTRAGGITEGALSDASRDDRRRLAGHSSADRTENYERGTIDLEAHRNVMEKRRAFRQKNSK